MCACKRKCVRMQASIAKRSSSVLVWESRDVRMTATFAVDTHGAEDSLRQRIFPSLFPSEGQRTGVAHVPSNKILHSRLYFFESSSI